MHKSDPSKILSYSVDDRGNRLGLGVFKNPGVNESAWYEDAAKAGKPIWSSIYVWAEPQTFMSISASTPVYDRQKKFVGVLGIDLGLSQISRFLKTLNSSRSGRIFIVERSGLLVASSGDETPTPIVNGKATRLRALDSREPLVRDVTQNLIQKFGSLQAISQPELLSLAIDRQLFVRVIPYRDRYGLDWLVAIVIPESEFMAEIEANNKTTILLCLLTLAIATGMAIITSNFIAAPIRRLSQASRAIAQGELSQVVEIDGVSELAVLADSFNDMASQLQASFQTLEHRVQERTAELVIAKDKLELLVALDSLTQIANRRRFDEYLALEWRHHQREQIPLALILIDIDYFKRYNDSYGHQIGDNCLVRVAQAIAKVPQRSTDLVARYGGEEFAVILPHTDRAGALKVATAIQTEVALLAIPHVNSDVSDRVTLSIGVASLVPRKEQSLEIIIADADRALYTAKAQGRDRVLAPEA